MLITKKRRTILTGIVLVLVTLATRIPFTAQYLYEFDSIDFAVATFRFDLAQFTPHPPGYILHVLLGRLLFGLTKDINAAFIWLSIVLSIGSVLFLWRAAVQLRGERVGVIAALAWMLAPMFWFYGEVATSYVHEAFFASAILYTGIKLLREYRVAFLYLLAIIFALSIGARQSSALFFAPAIIYMLYRIRPRSKDLFGPSLLFLALISLLFALLVVESGGLDQYASALGSENVYRTQSIFFGNPFSEHLGVFIKFVWLLLVGSLPILLLTIYGVVSFRGDFLKFLKQCSATRSARFAAMVAFPALVFYALIYFMKAGYLLNILPTIYLAGAVLTDEIAILHARKTRQKYSEKILLTRRLITQYTTIILTSLSLFQLAWFTLPQGNFTEYADLFSHQTFRPGMQSRYSGQKNSVDYAVNRALAYTTAAGVRMIDSIHASIYRTIRQQSKDLTRTVIFDTWWQRFSYYYFPEATGYDIRSYDTDTLFSSYRMKDYTLQMLGAEEILPERTQTVLLVIRDEHPDLAELQKRVRLEKLETPPHIDVYQVLDSAFELQWKNVRFIKH